MKENPETEGPCLVSGPVLVPEENRRPFLDHLEEFRRRVIRCLAYLAVGTALSWKLVPSFLSGFVAPVREVVFFNPAEPFLLNLQTALAGGFALSFPLLAWEAWAFVSPAVYPRERRVFFFFLPASVVLFFFGAWFGWRILLPSALNFFLQFGSDVLKPMISAGGYINFSAWLVGASGLVFETPLLVLFLVWWGVISPGTLLRQWRVAVVSILAGAAVLTPTPDVITQLLLALPMAFLYAASVLLSFLVARRKQAVA
ncbi:MAG: twin-arginine translocase subunit TatC [Candidatus Omnitrophica bacterium]|nr:twin-arginine translocase subunit TatC [Candidatus Omnitrophota bacterium]